MVSAVLISNIVPKNTHKDKNKQDNEKHDWMIIKRKRVDIPPDLKGARHAALTQLMGNKSLRIT